MAMSGAKLRIAGLRDADESALVALGSKHTLGTKFTGGRGAGSVAASAHRFKGSYTHAKKKAVIK